MDRAAAIAEERRRNHHSRTTPATPRYRADDITYDDTFTKEPEPLPF